MKSVYSQMVISQKKAVPLKLMLIGYLPPPQGGVRILFRQLCLDLNRKEDLQISVISMTGKNRCKAVLALDLIKTGIRVLLKIRRQQVVSFQPTLRALIILGPWIYLLSRIFKKPLVCRKFGGNFADDFEKLPRGIRKMLSCTILNADIWLFETRALCRAFAHRCPRVEYFPNSRPLYSDTCRKLPAEPGSIKILFLGHLKRGKGVADFFQLSAMCSADYAFDLYGPACFDMDEQEIAELESRFPARYRGEWPADRLKDLINAYHCLVFPSHLESEGYPGVVLEAFAGGLPVVAFRVGAVAEIVDSSCGELCEPGSLVEMETALKRILRADRYSNLSDGALKKAAYFDSELWSDRFFAICLELYEKRN